jgi:hypothetical protein
MEMAEMRRPSGAFWALLAASAVLAPAAACWIGAPIYDAVQTHLREARRAKCGGGLRPIGTALALYADDAGEAGQPWSVARLQGED